MTNYIQRILTTCQETKSSSLLPDSLFNGILIFVSLNMQLGLCYLTGIQSYFDILSSNSKMSKSLELELDSLTLEDM